MDPSQAPSHYKGLANKNVQSYSFKMLQKALEGGSTNDTIVTNGTHDNGHLSLNNIHNVHAPKMNQKDVNGGGQRFCPSPSPSSTMPRTESPAPIQRPGSSQSLPRPGSSKAAASPAFNRSANITNQAPSQMVGQAQTQGRISVASTEDIDYSSNKPKKVGNSFQWPPPRTQEDQGPTASPIYISPNSRTSSPAPRNVVSPSPAPARNVSSPAMNTRASPAPRNVSSPLINTNTSMMNGSKYAAPTQGMTSPPRSTIASPSPAAQSPVPILKNQTQIPVQMSNTPNRNTHVQFSNQQNGQKEWANTLNENVAGAAENAEDFTKNFMNPLGHPLQVPIKQNGAPNNLHNPAPMDKTPPFAANNSIPSNPEFNGWASVSQSLKLKSDLLI